MQKRIWALLDERQGNTSQTLGVAEALGVPFEMKKIAFNEFIRIPNFLINKTTIGLTPESVEKLSAPWPDITIGTARRLGIVASYIKSKNPSTFIAQIQWPGAPSSHFDLIAAPKHDNVSSSNNVFETVGAPHRVTQEILRKDSETWLPKINHLPFPRIAVLVGGSARQHKFGLQHAETLAILSSRFANTLGGSLLVTTSRRTGQDETNVIKKFITSPHYLYAWDDTKAASENPFYGFLGLADAVIATGDSISMCSEACATGKAVYIYASPDFVPKKHQQFVDELFKQGLAKPLIAQGSHSLFDPPYRLDDSATVAEYIKKKCSL